MELYWNVVWIEGLSPVVTFLTGFPARRPQQLGGQGWHTRWPSVLQLPEVPVEGNAKSNTKILNKSKKYEMHL